MSAKYMKVKQIVIPFLTVLLMVGQITGVVPLTSAEAVAYNQETPEVIIEIAELNNRQTIVIGGDSYELTTQAVYEEAKSKTGFTDVDDSKYYADAIKWAVDQKITNGIGNNQFGIHRNVTRAEAVTFLWRASGSPSPKGTAETFEDVEESSWYELAVKWAVENHITDGVGDNKFDPDGTVTRGQMITFLYRAKGQPGENREGDYWHSAAERWAYSKGLITGTAQTYTTNADCPRYDVVYYLWKEVENIDDGSSRIQQPANATNVGKNKREVIGSIDPEDGHVYTYTPADYPGGSYDAWIDEKYEYCGGEYTKAQIRSVTLDTLSGKPGTGGKTAGSWTNG